MKIKHTIMLSLLVSGVSLFGSEPFSLNKISENSSIFSEKPALFAKKKSSRMMNGDGEPNIAIKINATQLGLKNLSFQGEYGFHRKMSVALGFSYFMKRNLPGYQSDEHFGDINYGGYAITPEFRFYPGGREDKPAPRGFYIALYARYAKYKATQPVSYTEEKTASNPYPKTYTANSTQTYGGMNGGFMLGYQWIFGGHFTFDFWIFGAGYGKAKYTYEWVAPGANLNAHDQQLAEDAANEYLDNFSALGLKGSISTTSNSVKMTVPGVHMLSLRGLGLCFGYSF